MINVGERGTLLLIDDEPEITETILQLLENSGIQIIIATNGRQALEILAERPVDAILSDVRMPQMSGIEMLKEVRLAGLATPILLMSGYADHNMTLEALRAGVLDVIDKPFSRVQLLLAVRRAVALGMTLRKLHSDLRKFCGEREIDPQYVDMLKYISIFIVQQEAGRLMKSAQ